MIATGARRGAALAVLVALPALLAGCASNVTSRSPQPFPGAVRPPARAAASSWIDAARSATVVRTALALRGTSYRWGGDSPTTGFDCSGLVQYVFQEEGIAVPRTVAEQFQAGMEVPQDDVAPGDLVFFSTTAAGPTHVGIAIDAYRFVHAPDTGGVVRVDAIGTPYWWSRLVGVRRVVTSAAP